MTNEKIGHFIPKSKRAEISKEIRSAHFNFGYDCKFHIQYFSAQNIVNLNIL